MSTEPRVTRNDTYSDQPVRTTTTRRTNPLVSFLTLSGLANRGFRDIGLLLLRLATLPLIYHGLHKFHGYSGFKSSLAANSIGKISPDIFGFMVVAGQILLPIFIAVGLFTRWCGLLLSVLFAFIIFAVNIPSNGVMSEHGGFTFESSLYYAIPGLLLFLLGPGRISLDHIMNKVEGLFGRRDRVVNDDLR